MMKKTLYLVYFETTASGLFISIHDRIMAARDLGADFDVFFVVRRPSVTLRMLSNLFRRRKLGFYSDEFCKDGILYRPIFINEGIISILLRSISRFFGRNMNIKAMQYYFSGAINYISQVAKDYDIINCHWAVISGVIAEKIWQEQKIPYVITVHGSDFLFHERFHLNRSAMDKVFRNALKVYAVSYSLCSEIRQRIPSADVKVSPNSLRAEDIRKLQQLGASADKNFDICFIGSIESVKGADQIPDIISLLNKNLGRTISCVIAGKGSLRNLLETRTRERQHDVLFVGSVCRDEAHRLIARSKCLILPSRSEGLPLVILESLAIGTPVVSADVGGCSELLSGGQLVRRGCEFVEEFAQAVCKALVTSQFECRDKRADLETIILQDLMEFE